MGSQQHIRAVATLMVETILDGAETREAITLAIRNRLAPLTVTDAEIDEAAEYVLEAVEREQQARAASEAEASHGR